MVDITGYRIPLLEIRDSRLYRTTHGTFDEYCQVKWQMGKANANRVIAAAEVAGNLASALAIPSSIRQAFPLASLEPDVQREVWQRAVDTAPNGKVTGPHVQAIANEYRNGGPLPLTAANHAVYACQTAGGGVHCTTEKKNGPGKRWKR